MQRSPPSSPSCSGCRIDWRPSRGLVAALVMLSVLAAFSVSASALPGEVRRPLAGLVLLHGLLLARRQQAQPTCTLEWRGGSAPARLVGAGLDIEVFRVALDIRGPLVRLQGRDRHGRAHRLVWWPDTLPASARRQLVLAGRVSRRSDITLPSMAA